MGTAGRVLTILGAVAAAVVLFVVLRDGEGESTPTTATEPTTTESEDTTATDTVPNTGPTTTEPSPGPRRIRLTIPASGPEGIRQIEVEEGERVVLVIRSGVADHAHLHGYDLMADVGPGTVGTIRFRATIPGRFELELEDRSQQFAELTVAP